MHEWHVKPDASIQLLISSVAEEVEICTCHDSSRWPKAQELVFRVFFLVLQIHEIAPHIKQGAKSLF